MENAISYIERPPTEESVLLAGWHQWADAGSVSSGLPAYFIDQLDTRRVAEFKPDGFYLFQIPGMQRRLSYGYAKAAQ